MEGDAMKRLVRIGRAPIFSVLVTVLVASSAAASHPDILTNYRFIPSRSTLEVNGASTGMLEPIFHARGTFGIVTGFEDGVSCTAIGCPPPPTHIPFADFVDVNAWLIPDSPLTYVLNLDRTLNLSGLDGTFGNLGRDHLFFKGKDGKGRPFHLEALVRGPLIHLLGESGPGCCDIDHYIFDALAYRRPHPDMNLDGTVDAADYVMWRKTIDAAAAGLGIGDGTDVVDFNVWRASFGEVTDFSVFANDGLSSGTVPEPATVALWITAFVIPPIFCGRYKR
jgi:hypothetical protein